MKFKASLKERKRKLKVRFTNIYLNVTKIKNVPLFILLIEHNDQAFKYSHLMP